MIRQKPGLPSRQERVDDHSLEDGSLDIPRGATGPEFPHRVPPHPCGFLAFFSAPRSRAHQNDARLPDDEDKVSDCPETGGPAFCRTAA
eukprot:3072697-Pyramimonas_sp.AAC.1